MADAGGGAGRRITVRSVSCRGVKSFVPFQKPPLYAAVSHGGRREKTPADPDGGENADWDGAVFAFDLDGRDDDGLLRFEVKAQVPLLGTKLVGSACVPVADLAGAGAPRRASYQLLAPDGKPNGSLSFVCSVTDAPAVGYQQQPQIYAARPEQDLNNSCCAPPPPPPSSWAPYPAPGMPNAAPHGSGYPPSAPPASAPLYPPLQDFLPPSSYPPPPPRPTTDPLFPAPNFGSHSSYPRPPTVYPPPPASCTACPAPPAQYISSSYPPPPPSYYPPPPPSGYPPPARMNPEYPASTFPPTACSYPPPAPQPQPEFCSECPPSPAPRSVDRALHYMAPSSQGSAITHPELAVPQLPSGGSYYPPPGTRHREEEARPPYYYPPPGTRHREEEAKPPYYYPPPGTRYS